MSHTQRILTLFNQGFGVAEISRRAGCSQANVSMTLRRNGRWRLLESALDKPLAEFIRREAEKAGVAPEDMARAMLVDAMAEAMGE